MSDLFFLLRAEGGGYITLDLFQLWLVEACSVTKTEARCISQTRKLRATITGAKTQEAPQDQTQPLDWMRQTPTELEVCDPPPAGSSCKRITDVSFTSKTSYFTAKLGNRGGHNTDAACSPSSSTIETELHLYKNVQELGNDEIRTILTETRIKGLILAPRLL